MSTVTVPLQQKDTNQPEPTIVRKKSKLVSFSDKENSINGQQSPQTEKPTLFEDSEPPKEQVPEPQPTLVIEQISEQPWAKFLTEYTYSDFGGDHQEEEDTDGFFYGISNDNIHDLDEIAVDEHDIMSLSGEDSLTELSEDEEAEEYAKFLNLPSTDYALAKVGTNELLFSWVEKQFSGVDDKTIAEYERISLEIEKVERRLKSGIELVLQYFLQTETGLWVSSETVDFCRRLFMRYVGVVFDTAKMIASIRDENTTTLFQEDFVNALKHLGRTVYYEKSENNEEEDEDVGNDTFFDPAVMRILTNLVFGELVVNDETNMLLQKSFEDFFSILVSNACKIQREYKEQEPLSVQDLEVVFSLWQNSPYESSNSLIQKISL
jgi:hypothetical protein